MEKIIKSFFKLSLNNNLNRFNFRLFFNLFEQKLYDKLSSHGQLSFNDYVLTLNKYYNLSNLTEYEYNSKHTNQNININDIYKSLFFERFIIFYNKYKNNKNYITMLDIYSQIMHLNKLNKLEQIILVDKCIHLQHNSGFIHGLNIVKIRLDIDGNKKV